MELLRRPLFASLAVALARDGRLPDAARPNRAALIGQALDLWTEGEHWRSMLSADTRRQFLVSVACRMQSNSSLSLPRTVVEEVLLGVSAELKSQPRSTALAAGEVRACSVLQWHEGRAAFQHKALVDYLLAERVAREFREWSDGYQEAGASLLGGHKLGREVLELVAELGVGSAEAWRVVRWTRGRTGVECGYTGGNAAAMLGQILGTAMTSGDFSRCVLRDASFRGVVLRDARFDGAILAHSNFDGCDLRGASFRACDLSYVSLKSGRSLYCCASVPWAGVVVVGGTDGQLHYLNTRNGAEVLTVRAHDDYVLSCAADASGRQIVSGGRDQRIRRWGGDSLGGGYQDIGGHFDSVRALAFDGRDRILSAGSDGRVVCWSIREAKELWACRLSDDPLWDLVNEPAKGQALVGGAGGFWVLRVQTGDATPLLVDEEVTAVAALSRDGGAYILGLANGTVLIARQDTKFQCEKVAEGRRGSVPRRILVVGDGEACLVLWSDGVVTAFDGAVEGIRWERRVHADCARAACLCGDGKVVSVGYDGIVAQSVVDNGAAGWSVELATDLDTLRCDGLDLDKVKGLHPERAADLRERGARLESASTGRS